MIGSFSTALSGLQASSRHMQNSANNIANIQSTTSSINGETVKTPYRPTDVVQTSLSTGGVSASLRERDPASVNVYDPSNVAANEEGVTEYPNVNLEEEVIQTQIASYNYKANLNVLETSAEMMDELTDILA